MQYAVAFLEGIITFISPWLLPMLPIYTSYFAGGGQRTTKKTLLGALGFVSGFTVIFVAMGAETLQRGIDMIISDRWWSAYYIEVEYKKAATVSHSKTEWTVALSLPSALFFFLLFLLFHLFLMVNTQDVLNRLLGNQVFLHLFLDLTIFCVGLLFLNQ